MQTSVNVPLSPLNTLRPARNLPPGRQPSLLDLNSFRLVHSTSPRVYNTSSLVYNTLPQGLQHFTQGFTTLYPSVYNTLHKGLQNFTPGPTIPYSRVYNTFSLVYNTLPKTQRGMDWDRGQTQDVRTAEQGLGEDSCVRGSACVNISTHSNNAFHLTATTTACFTSNNQENANISTTGEINLDFHQQHKG